jgi:hypothetical protein
MVKKANWCNQGQKTLSQYSAKEDAGGLLKRSEGFLDMDILTKAQEA